MLVLKKLTFENIGRFTESQTIDFTSLGSLVQVDGSNLNTGGSSGAGKSTVFKALDFLLGLNDVSTTILQSRLTKNSMSVTGLFELDGVPLKIERGKKLSIDLNGEVTTGSSKLTEEKLDLIIGMSRELFRKILHKRQSEGGFFLEMGPSEVHKFLTSCLSLEAEQCKIVRLDERLATLSASEALLKSGLEANRTGLHATKAAVNSLGDGPILSLGIKAIEALRSEHKTAFLAYEPIKVEHKKQTDDLEATRPQIQSNPFDRSDIERLEAEYQAIIKDVASLEKKETDRQAEVKTKIPELQIMIRDIEAKELQRQSDVKLKISAIKSEVNELENKERDRQAEVQSQQTLNQVSQMRAQAEIVEGDRAKAAATNLAAELNKIRASLCPTCEQGWVTEAAKAKEVDIIQKLQDCKKSVVAGMAAQRELVKLKEEQEILRTGKEPRPIEGLAGILVRYGTLAEESQPQVSPEIEPINTQIDQLKLDAQTQIVPEVLELKMKADYKNSELDVARKMERQHQFTEDLKNKALLANFESKRTDLLAKQEKLVNETRNVEIQTYQALHNAENSLKSYDEAKDRFDASYNKLTGQVGHYLEQILNTGNQLDAITEELELATESKKAIKSYLSASFEDALDSIGDAATRFIRAIPNMQNATVQFEGLKETKEGKVKEEVTCVISMDGESQIPIKSLSGGERSSIDLAVDLAVVSFIEERTGKGSNLYIMDEPFQFLDSVNVEQILEMINNSSISKTILIVDHNPVVKEMVGEKIMVIRDGEQSRILHEK